VTWGQVVPLCPFLAHRQVIILFKILFHKLNFGGTMVRGCGGAEVRESSK
jgi:hypothetical protein